eukprot:9711770-Heterocapsa_arctica.AAC.1
MSGLTSVCPTERRHGQVFSHPDEVDVEDRARMPVASAAVHQRAGAARNLCCAALEGAWCAARHAQ